jgi:hypothetical protein
MRTQPVLDMGRSAHCALVKPRAGEACMCAVRVADKMLCAVKGYFQLNPTPELYVRIIMRKAYFEIEKYLHPLLQVGLHPSNCAQGSLSSHDYYDDWADQVITF